MTATNKLALELLAAAAANQTLANTTFAQLNQLVQAGAVDKDLTAPPGSPANEALYIVAASATGAWAGKDGQLAYWLTSTNAWQFIVPREGFLVHVNDEDDYYKYDGSAWGVFSPGGGLTNPMTTLGDIIRGAASGTPERVAVGTDGQVLTVVSGAPEWADPAGGGFSGGTLTAALNEAPAVTIASAATVNIGAAAANTISITGTTTITAFDTIADGAVRLLEFAGALTLTHNGTSLILPTGANIVTAAGDVAEFRSLGSGKWRCVGYMRADGTSLAGGGGGGLTDLAEAKNTAAPNATVPAVSLSVTITETNGDVAIVPKGTGAVLAAIPTSSAAGGNKRGNNAVDLQTSRTGAAQVASGNWSSLIGGQQSSAGGTHAVAGGYFADASGPQSIALGGQAASALAQYTTAIGGNGPLANQQYGTAIGGNGVTVTGSVATGVGGDSNIVDGAYGSIVGGARATSRGVYGAESRASGRFSVNGDAQRERFILRRSTTNATATALSADGGAPAAAAQITLPNNSAYEFRGRVVARENATGDCAAWEFKGLIRRGANAAATALVATVTPASIAADAGAAAWVVAVTADTTLGCLAITVTGEASHTIRWVADIETVEVVG